MNLLDLSPQLKLLLIGISVFVTVSVVMWTLAEITVLEPMREQTRQYELDAIENVKKSENCDILLAGKQIMRDYKNGELYKVILERIDELGCKND